LMILMLTIILVTLNRKIDLQPPSIFSLLYESPRRKPDWRFTAGAKYRSSVDCLVLGPALFYAPHHLFRNYVDAADVNTWIGNIEPQLWYSMIQILKVSRLFDFNWSNVIWGRHFRTCFMFPHVCVFLSVALFFVFLFFCDVSTCLPGGNQVDGLPLARSRVGASPPRRVIRER